MDFALNQMTVPRLPLTNMLDVAAQTGCSGVELRNDLGRPLFDGLPPQQVAEMLAERGLTIYGVSQIYPFNDWSPERAEALEDLAKTAKAAGAQSVSLIPRNDGTAVSMEETRSAIEAAAPILGEAGIVGLIEPLGFSRSSLRFKAELVEMLETLGLAQRFKLVHDTFHHTLAGGGALYPEHTGIVHISAVVDPGPDLDQMEDADRVLVSAQDRLGNIEQLRALEAAGYAGPISFECFSPEVHALEDPAAAIRTSMKFISSQLAVEAA